MFRPPFPELFYWSFGLVHAFTTSEQPLSRSKRSGEEGEIEREEVGRLGVGVNFGLLEVGGDRRNDKEMEKLAVV
ncbi:hypothetical protein L1887_06091 [Cichorium endivia]|nr:hypothetical protein L1887_06091 [Cichorium endivia]